MTADSFSTLQSEQLYSNGDTWQITYLLERALRRYRERILPFFLLSLLFIPLILLLSIGGVIIEIVFGFLAKLVAIPVLTRIPIFLLLFAMVYATAYIILGAFEILISEQRIGVFEAIKRIRPYALGFVWFSILNILFNFGLFLFGILSLYIVYLLWLVWGTFSIFVYLDRREKGLKSLWISKAIISQKFWTIAIRILITSIPILFLSIILPLILEPVFGKGVITYTLRGVFVVLELLYIPFTICFNYEMYKNLDKSVVVKKPKIWIILSVIGWVINILLIIFLLNNVLPIASKYFKGKNLPPIGVSITVPNGTR